MATIDRRGLMVDGSLPSSSDMPDVGLAIKLACRAASTANLVLAGLQTVDGVALSAGNRVLAKNQTDATQNGIYVVSTGNWSRSVDFDASAEIASGVLVAANTGTIGGQKFYQLTTPDPIVLDTSSLIFSTVAGEIGPAGPIGLTGPIGSTGATGPQGLSGTAALTRVRVASTANVAISTAMENGDTLNGVVLATDDLILLTGQTAPAENGVYVVAASGAAARHPDFDAYDELPGTVFSVMEGALKADTLWQCTSNRGGTIGVTSIVITEIGSSIPSGTVTAATLATSATGVSMINGTLAVSAASNILTVAVKTLAGANPSTADPVLFVFSNGTGGYVVRSVTAALSHTLSSGSTVGASNATAFRLWHLAIDTGSAVVLGSVNCRNGKAILALNSTAKVTSTAEGGVGGADSAATIYSAAAQTSKYFSVLGCTNFESGLTTAGTWIAPTETVLYRAGGPLPGQPTGNINYTLKTDTYSSSTTTTLTDITGLSATIIPSSKCNAILAEARVVASTDTGGSAASFVLLRGSTNIGGGVASSARISAFGGLVRTTDGNSVSNVPGLDLDFPLADTSQTYKVQFMLQSSGTIYVNRTASDGDTAGVGRYSSSLTVREIMG